MADKNLDLGVKVNEPAVKKEMENLKKIIQDALKGSISIEASLKTVVKEVNEAAEEIKRIAADLKAYRKAQDEDLAREEIAIAKRVAKELAEIQKAQFAQATQVNKQMTATGGFNTNQLAAAQKTQSSNLLHLNEGLAGYITGVKNLLEVQLRWYAAKPITMLVIETPQRVIKSVIDYTVAVDEANAALLRWGASSGKVTPQMKVDISNLVDNMRNQILDIPISLEKLTKAVQGFIGAGVEPMVVKGFTKEIAALAGTYPEMDFEKFATAITGFKNLYHGAIQGAKTDTEEYKVIMDQMNAAQAQGVIRPEAFTTVLQNLGTAAQSAGFTTSQMLALTLTVTDLGPKAGNATRALRGVIEQMGKWSENDVLRGKLAQLGIEIDRNKTIAEQFVPIAIKLRDVLGGNAPLSAGASGILSQLIPVERAGALKDILKDIEKYQAATERIASSQGGVLAGIEPKISSIKGQYELLGNTLDRLFTDLSLGANTIKDVVAGLLDMARGALYAVNPTLATAEHMDRLGTAGKTAYEVMGNLSTIFNEVKIVLGPVVSGLGSLIASVLSSTLAINILADVLIVKLAAGGINMAITGLIKLEAVIRSLYIAQSAGLWAESLSSSFSGLISPANLALIAIAALVAEVAHYYGEVKRVQAETAALQNQVTAMNASALAMKEVAIQKQLEAMEKVNGVFGEEGSNWGLGDIKKYQELLKQLDLVRNQRSANEGYQPGMAKGSDTGGKAPPVLAKKGGHGGMMEVSAAKEMASALLGIEESYRKTILSYANNAHKLGLMSDKEFYEAEVAEMVKSRDAKLKVIDIEIEDIKTAYNTRRKDAKNPEQIKALDDKEEADLKKVEQKKIEIINNTASQVVTKETEYVLRRHQILLQGYQTDLEITKTFSQARLDTIISAGKLQEEYTKYLYETGGTTATAYYDKIVALVNDQTDAKKRALDDEYNAGREKQDREFTTEGTTTTRKQQIIREQEKDYFAYLANIEKADRENASEIFKIRLQMKEDIKKIFEDLGASGAVGKALRDITVEYDNMGKNLYDSTKTVFSSMENIVTDFTYRSSDNFGNMANFAISALTMIEKELLRILIIKPLLGGISGALNGWLSGAGYGMGSGTGGGGADFYGTIPVRASGGPVEAGQPYIVGERRPELFVPRSSGTVYPGVAQPNLNVTVNFKNETSVPATAQVSSAQFNQTDGYIINVVLKELNGYTPLRQTVQRLK